LVEAVAPKVSGAVGFNDRRRSDAIDVDTSQTSEEKDAKSTISIADFETVFQRKQTLKYAANKDNSDPQLIAF
jgi:hypothetical protein